MADDLNLSVSMDASDLASASINKFERNVVSAMASATGASSKFSTMLTTMAASMTSFSAIGVGAVVVGLTTLIGSMTSTSEATKKLNSDLDLLANKFASTGIAIADIAEEFRSLKAPDSTLKRFFSMFIGENEGIKPEMFDLLAASMNRLFEAIESARGDKLGAMATAFKVLGVEFEDAQGKIKKTSDILMEFDQIISRPGGLARNVAAGGAIQHILGEDAPAFIIESQKRLSDLREALEQISLVEPSLSGRFKFLSEIVRDGKEAAKQLEKDWKDAADAIIANLREVEIRNKKISDENQKNSERMAHSRAVAAESIARAESDTVEILARQAGVEAQINLVYDNRKAALQDLLISHTGQEARLRELIALNEKMRDIDLQRAGQVGQKLAAINRQITVGFKSAMIDVATVIGQDIVGSLDLVLDKTKSVTDKIREFIAGVLKDLARLALQQAVLGGIKGIFGAGVAAAEGAVFSGGFKPEKQFASGSPYVDRPTVGLIGEGENAEAVIPLPDNRNVPVKLMGNTGGGPTIHFNVTTDDAQSFQRAERKLTQMLQRVLASNYPIRKQLASIT